MRKKTFFVALAAMLLTVNANAQSNENEGKGRPDPSEMIQKRTDEMVSTYGLDSEQAEKLLELNKKYAKNMGPKGRGPRPEPRDSAFAEGKRPAPPQQGGQNGECQAPPQQDGKCCCQGGGPKGPQGGPDKSQMEAYNTELKAIIGDENFSKYEESMKQRMKPRGEKPEKKSQE